jgi:hypothetical protein
VAVQLVKLLDKQRELLDLIEIENSKEKSVVEQPD